MKTLRLIGMALIVALLGVGVYACSDDDVCECSGEGFCTCTGEGFCTCTGEGACTCTGEGFCSCSGDDFCTCTDESVDSSDDAVEDDTPTLPASGTINGYEYVDLGLSVKWATCNVGASSPSDYGDYFAWGETSTKSDYSSSNSETYGRSMGGIAGDPQYDVARANWGGTWRLPTADEIDELVNKCTRTWTTQGGHNGYRVTGPNGNSIFLPAAGWRNGTSLYYAGEYGDYWSAAPNEDNAGSAYRLCFDSGDFYGYWFSRNDGMSVRPVSE